MAEVRRTKAGPLALAAGILVLGLTACDAGSAVDAAAEPRTPPPPVRSAEAFCAVHDEHKANYLAAFDSADQSMSDGQMLLGVLQAGVAFGDLSSMWRKLAAVAPEDIRIDIEMVAEGWEKQSDLAAEMLDHPIKALAGALAGSFKLAGPLQRVDQFVRDNCDGAGPVG